MGADLEKDLVEMRARMERERRKLRALQEIGVLLGSTLDLNELLSMVLERISDVVDADRATLYLLDDEAGELFAEVSQGGSQVEIRLKVGEGLAGTVAKSGKSLNVKDAYQDVRFDAEWDRRTGYRTRSILCVPMKNQHGRTIGVVQVLNKLSGYFTTDDEALLGALAAQAAVSIENSKLFLSVVGKNIELLETQERLQRKIQELDVLFEIAQVSAGAEELDELLQGVLARSMRAIDAEAASILLADDLTGDLHFRAAVGGEPEGVKRLRIKAGQGISGWVAKHGKPQIVNRVREDPRHSQTISDEVDYHARSVLCVPLRWDDGGGTAGTGAVELLNKARGAADFEEDDLKLATLIAGHISTAIENARARERREREDRLSGLGRLLSGILHDLHTPMTVIKGYAKMLGKELPAEERESIAATVLSQVDMMNNMTREMLAFARGDRKLLVRRVYLYKFFEELVGHLENALGDRMEIVLKLNDRGIAHFDEAKLQRAVHNLARNAAEASKVPEGERGLFKITVDREEGETLVLRFEDDGPGIPDAIRARLFESFATHGKKQGTGLGLAIVKQVVEDHGGTIEVTSDAKATVFEMRLPTGELATSPGRHAAAS